MSAKAKTAAHQVKGLHPAERLVLFSLAHDAKPVAGVGCRSRLTAEQLHTVTGLSVRSVRTCIGVLAKHGHITRLPTRPGGIFETLVHPDPTSPGHRPEISTRAKRKIKPGLARAVMERDRYRCVTCGTHLGLGCDHIIPESQGGPTTLDNLQTMCGPCNSAKGARMPDE